MFCFSFLPLRQLKFIGQGREEWAFGRCSRGCHCPTHISYAWLLGDSHWKTKTLLRTSSSCRKILGPLHRTGWKCWGINHPSANEKQELVGHCGTMGSLTPLQWDSSEACSKPSPEALRGVVPQLPTELRCSLHPEELPSLPCLISPRPALFPESPPK